MEIIELCYHIGVIIVGLVVFFLKWTAENSFLEAILKVIFKFIPLFVIMYAGVQIFKIWGII